MPRFIDPSGHTNFGIAICDRCHFKFPSDELKPDPNYPGLRVCEGDRDQFDPWRLPARHTERITLPFVRPDVPIDGGTLYGSVNAADSSQTVDGSGTVDEVGPAKEFTGDYTVDRVGDLQPNTGFTPQV